MIRTFKYSVKIFTLCFYLVVATVGRLLLQQGQIDVAGLKIYEKSNSRPHSNSGQKTFIKHVRHIVPSSRSVLSPVVLSTLVNVECFRKEMILPGTINVEKQVQFKFSRFRPRDPPRA